MRWQYIMPQHTGTGAVVRVLDANGYFTHGCSHLHAARSPVHAKRYAAFTFLASPFKRVLSNAAFCGVIDAKTPNAASDVPKFRAWLASHLRPPVDSIGDLMGPPGFMDLYGRLEHLDYDLGAILRRLGYTKLPKERAKFHCISSCGAVAGSVLASRAEKGGGASLIVPAAASEKLTKNKMISDIAWFDDASAMIVLKWYAKDFSRFNFSTSPRCAWSDASLLTYELGPRQRLLA
jgi:hypothetical protein